MPKISVVIEYDSPKDPMWLNPDNVSVALSAYCKNTNFSVEWAKNSNQWDDSNTNLEKIEQSNSLNQQTKVQISQALARGYCSDKNSSKVLDTDLIEAMVEELVKTLTICRNDFNKFKQRIDMDSEKRIEEKITEKGLNAPRLKPEDIDAKIKSKTFTNLPSGKCVICEITLQNGFTVRGESACVSPKNFDQEIGNDVAFKNARDKIWAFEGYLLQEKFPVE